jgi:hypothetical protein
MYNRLTGVQCDMEDRMVRKSHVGVPLGHYDHSMGYTENMFRLGKTQRSWWATEVEAYILLNAAGCGFVPRLLSFSHADLSLTTERVREARRLSEVAHAERHEWQIDRMDRWMGNRKFHYEHDMDDFLVDRHGNVWIVGFENLSLAKRPTVYRGLISDMVQRVLGLKPWGRRNWKFVWCVFKRHPVITLGMALYWTRYAVMKGLRG